MKPLACASGDCTLSFALGVGHPEQSLPDVRRADARSAQIGGSERIAQCFHVSAYSGEPFTSIAARNLLSKDRCRLALGDESQHVGPQVPLVGGAFAFAGRAERLAGATSRPNRSVVGPACESQGEGPAEDSGEQVDLVCLS
jgi:hypothetical protein